MSSDDDMEADLGLGNGLKPGALTENPLTLSVKGIRSNDEGFPDEFLFGYKHNHAQDDDKSDSDEEFTLMPIQQVYELKAKYSHLNRRTKRCKETTDVFGPDDMIYDGRYFSEKTNQCENKSKCDKDPMENGPSFPVYAEVPYGTSIRQQKELFKHNLEEICRKKGPPAELILKSQCNSS